MNLPSNLPPPRGHYVRLNNAPLIVDTDLNAEGFSLGTYHRIISVAPGHEGEVMLNGTTDRFGSDSEVAAIIDDLLRGKFEALS